MNIAPNGKIDASFEQGSTGDCWLLAGIKAISISPKGLKILNDSIRVNNDSSVTVTLKGVNKTYTFTQQEINASTEFSTGDLDVRALEMAFDRYFAEERGVRGRIDLNGNGVIVAYKILTGQSHLDLRGLDNLWDRIFGITQGQIDRFNDKNHITCVSCHSGRADVRVPTTSGASGILVSNHAYAVSRADDKYVYLYNPWDTNTELRVDVETFKDFFNSITELDLE